jgi:hypothetical protein
MDETIVYTCYAAVSPLFYDKRIGGGDFHYSLGISYSYQKKETPTEVVVVTTTTSSTIFFASIEGFSQILVEVTPHTTTTTTTTTTYLLPTYYLPITYSYLPETPTLTPTLTIITLTTLT